MWSQDAWTDILGRFIHVEKPSKGSKARPTVIFPRFHQWDAVRRLEADAKVTGAGRNYLVQHSAGSGKSNSIARRQRYEFGSEQAPIHQKPGPARKRGWVGVKSLVWG